MATFFLFFGDSKKFVGAAKNEQGAPNGNVTPLVGGGGWSGRDNVRLLQEGQGVRP